MALPPVQSDLVYFTVVGNFRAMVADSVADQGYEPDLAELTATATFTPLVNTGDALLITNSVPPIHLVPTPITAIIDTDGVLKLRRDFTDIPDGPYTKVRLLGDSESLELETPLFYRVDFTNVRLNGKPGVLNSYEFQAPDHDMDLDLVEVMRQPGVTAVGITKLAPSAVRVNENGDLVFSFGGVDIPDPVDLGNIAGAEGPAGPPGPAGEPGADGQPGADGTAATIAVGTTTTGAAGTPANVTNKGTANAAVFDFTIPAGPAGPKGDTGATGSAGATGPAGPAGTAATIAVGTTITGAAGTNAAVTNKGTANAAVFDFTIPKGADGAVGPAGPAGTAATIAVGTTTTGAAGTNATVTNKGTASAAVFDFVIPAGPAGAKGDTGAAGATGPAGPAGAKGDTGATGATGPAGPAGAKGDTGAAGPAGPPGPTAVSADAGNTSRLGSDGKIFTPASSGPAGVVTGNQGGTVTSLVLWTGTAAQYSGIAAKDPKTVYVVVPAFSATKDEQ